MPQTLEHTTAQSSTHTRGQHPLWELVHSAPSQCPQHAHPPRLFFYGKTLSQEGESWEKVSLQPIPKFVAVLAGATEAALAKAAERWAALVRVIGTEQTPVSSCFLALTELSARSRGWGWGRGVRKILGVPGCSLPRYSPSPSRKHLAASTAAPSPSHWMLRCGEAVASPYHYLGSILPHPHKGPA